MYRSKKSISHLQKELLKTDFLSFLQKNKSAYCRALKRKVSLGKLPEAILKRSSSSTSRLKCFFVALDILQKEKEYTSRSQKYSKEYEIVGMDKNNKIVKIHLREEENLKKDKILYFISCY